MLPLSQYHFPDPIEADPDEQGLICIGADLSPATLFEAYTHGLFPWFSEDEPICWWCPEPRCIIRPQDYQPSKTLLRSMKKQDYRITINQAFERVIRACSLPRSYADDTWISEDIIDGYCAMFDAGYGYSVEVWDQTRLVGGLYGISIGHGCFGESMFSTETDVSTLIFAREAAKTLVLSSVVKPPSFILTTSMGSPFHPFLFILSTNSPAPLTEL